VRKIQKFAALTVLLAGAADAHQFLYARLLYKKPDGDSCWAIVYDDGIWLSDGCDVMSNLSPSK
jgi:hypothetical protein